MAEQNKSPEQIERESRQRQEAAGIRTRKLRDEYLGIGDREVQAGQTALSNFDAETEKQRDAYTGMVTRALSAAQAGMQQGEQLSIMEKAAMERKRTLEADLLSKKKSNIETKQKEGNVDTDYDGVIAEGMKEMTKAISDTRGPWYEGGDDEEEAERRMRVALNTLRSKNKEAADYLEAYFLNPQGEGYRSNHDA